MNSANDTNQPNRQANLYTICPGSISAQGNTNYGFYSSHPLAPPPKYEDVMSGHYLYMNNTSIRPQSTSADVNNNEHINCSEINNFQRLQSELNSQQSYKNKKFNTVGRLLEQNSMPPSVFSCTHQQEAGQTGIFLVAPVSKVMGTNGKLLLIFIISFLAGFTTILLWKLG